ncbi:GGDEF domain-containing protein [Glaciecola petra]|uniref:diguanylate cyclase n=1 Tax=Glaciecola petra TaxID=3075602 RepID=A0ABU2ZLS5_9ALTE|nr:GGDEF domain-containing protein [Aestuariibacter sp. P117]MDT0593579.1 GGDEF domain-containing protein [Aestuariibacter sp. P117]
MISFLKNTASSLGKANFLTRTAFGISSVACLIMVPFGVNNFIQDRYAGGVTALLVAGLFALNVLLTYRGKYSLHLNLFGIAPALALASVTAIVSLKEIGSFWSYLCVFGIYYILPFAYAKWTNLVFSLAVLSAALIYLPQDLALRFCIVLMGINIFIFISMREITKTQVELVKQANTDVLTGLLNRSKLDEHLNRAILDFKQNKTPSAICLIDIDHFKTINDTYGHDTGDKVLKNLATELQNMISDNDYLFRIGGEEFLLLLTDTKAKDAWKVADAIRAIVSELPLLKEQEVTMSIGVAAVKAEYDWKLWMKSSDAKLYDAKRNGRNQVVS